MRDDTVTSGSGNVYADIGLPDAEERLVRADLAIAFLQAITRRGDTYTQVAEMAGLSEEEYADLSRGRLDAFPGERLIVALNRIGVGVQIVLADQPDWIDGTTSVHVQRTEHGMARMLDAVSTDPYRRPEEGREIVDGTSTLGGSWRPDGN